MLPLEVRILSNGRMSPLLICLLRRESFSLPYLEVRNFYSPLVLSNSFLQPSLPPVPPLIYQNLKNAMVSLHFSSPFRFSLVSNSFTPFFASYGFPDEIRSLGVDEVYCLSVNDAFVMRQVNLSPCFPSLVYFILFISSRQFLFLFSLSSPLSCY